MKTILIDKKYIYEREGKQCLYCAKNLGLGKVTLDHYFPKSFGGSSDVFNLVCCCKKCNASKGSQIPDDWEKVNLSLFTRAVLDRKILAVGGLQISHAQLDQLAVNVQRVFASGAFIVFETDDTRLYIKENKVFKLVTFHRSDPNHDD